MLVTLLFARWHLVYGRAVAKPRVFSAEHRRFVSNEYLKLHNNPAYITEKLNAKFGSGYTVRQVSTMISDQGWPAKRREVSALVESAEQQSVAQLAKAHTNALAKYAPRMDKLIDKGLKFAEKTNNVRQFATAIAAAQTAMKTFRLASGLDENSGGSGGMNGTAFTITFTKGDPMESMKRAVPVHETLEEKSTDGGNA